MTPPSTLSFFVLVLCGVGGFHLDEWAELSKSHQHAESVRAAPIQSHVAPVNATDPVPADRLQGEAGSRKLESHLRPDPHAQYLMFDPVTEDWIEIPYLLQPQGGTIWPDSLLWATIFVCLIVMGVLGFCLKDWALEKELEEADRGNEFLGTTAAPEADPEAVDSTTEQSKEKRYHRIPWQQYFALCFWYALLLTNVCVTRLLCHRGIPHDCHDRTDKLRELHSLQVLVTMGFIIAVLCGVIQQDRFGYIFNMTSEGYYRGAIFIFFFMGSSIVWGSMDLLPSLSAFTLTTSGEKDNHFTILLYGLTIGAAGIIAFHFVWAFRYNSFRGFLAYAISRVSIWTLYVMLFIESNKTIMADFHLHHYMVGFLIAIIAEFNHPISLLLLAIGSGIFVQGLAAYNADPLIYRRV